MIYVDFYKRINLGDDLFVRLLCARFPNESFITCAPHEYKKIFSDIPNMTVQTYDENIIKKAYNKLIQPERQMMKSAEACVYIGGSLFMEGENAQEGIVLNKHRLEYSKRLFIINVNFGPYKTAAFRNEYEKIFSKCAGVCFRDKISYEMFSHLTNVTYAPDAVFSLDMPKPERGNFVLVSPEYMLFDENYKTKLEKYTVLCNTVLGMGYGIKLLSTCEYEGCEKVISDIIRSVGQSNNVSAILYRGECKEAIQAAAGCDFVITGRFHPAVLGAICRKKIIVLGCEKLRSALDGKIAHYTDIDTIYGADAEKIKEILKKIPTYEIKQLEIDAKCQFEQFKNRKNSKK